MPKPTKQFTRFNLDNPTTAREVLQLFLDRDLAGSQYTQNQLRNLLREVPAMKDAVDKDLELRWFDDPAIQKNGPVSTQPGFYSRRLDVVSATWQHEPAAQFSPQDAARYFGEMAFTV